MKGDGEIAERLAYLEAVVGADITEFRKSMRQIRNDVGILSETIQGIGGAARTMTFAFTAPMVALGTYAVQAASGFDGAMRNINSIVKLSESDFANLESKVMAFAQTTRGGVVPATEALYEVFSAGIMDQEKALAIWETSVRVAESGLADVSKTTNAVTATMSAYNLQTSEAGRVGNIWARMVQMGVGSLDNFLSNAQKVLPLSSAMNISLEDMGATLAFLSQGGGGAAKAETSYAMMLSNMMKPTTAMTDALHSLGVATGTDLIKKFGSVADAVMALKKVTDETTFNKMFSKTGLEAALRITNNFDAMKKAAKDFNDNLDTATMSAWEEQAKSFSYQWDQMKTRLEAVAITIGKAIIPLITPLMAGFSGILQNITALNPQVVQLGVLFAGVAVALPPIIWLFTSMINPIGLIIAGVTTLAAAFTTNFGGIRDTVTNVVTGILGDLAPLQSAFDEFIKTLFPEQKDLVPPAGSKPTLDIMDTITVTEPKSLWQIYEEKGYSKKFTWEEFMKEAKKGGWKGGTVNIGDMITITGGEAVGSGVGAQFASGMEKKIAGEASTIVPPTIWDRLVEATVNAWPKVEIAMSGLWTNITNWVTTTGIPTLDKVGSGILDSISGWFGTTNSNFTGDTPVYGMLKGAMTADVGAAAGDAGGIFAKAFPSIISSFQNLLQRVGAWIESEGAPTIARSIGFMIGRIGSLIRDGLGTLWSGITGGISSVNGGQAVDAVKTIVLSPLSEGVSEGIGEATNKNPFDVITDKLSSMAVVAFGAWVLAPNVVSLIATPIKNAVISAALSVANATGISAAFTKMTTLLGGMATTALGAISIVGIGAIIISALLSNEDIQGGLKAWTGVWDNFKIIVEKAVDGIAVKLRDMKRDLEETLADIEFKAATAVLMINPNDMAVQASGQKAGNEKLALGFSRVIEDSVNNYLKGAAINFDLGNITPFIDGTANNPQVTDKLLNSITDPNNLMAALGKAQAGGDTQAVKLLLPIALEYEAKQQPFTNVQIQELVKSTGLDQATVASLMEGYYKDNPVKLTEIDVAINGLKATPAEAMGIDTTLVSAQAAAMTAPYNTEFTNTFGSAGTVTTLFNDFKTQYGIGVDEINTKSGTVMPQVTDKVKKTMDSIINGAISASDKIKALTSDMNALNGVNIVFKVSAEASSGIGLTPSSGKATPPVDGSHAAGLSNVPWDGYIAQLHRGEMVVPKKQADTIRAGTALPKSNNSGTIDNSNATFNFYETMDFEGFMREAKRRGYNLDKYSR